MTSRWLLHLLGLSLFLCWIASTDAWRLPTTLSTTSLFPSSSSRQRNAHRLPSSWALYSSSTAASTQPSPSSEGTEKLCKNCKTYFNPSDNHDRACRYHTKPFTGDTKRKGDWSANADRFEVEKMWWCCGDEDPQSLGCKYDRHRSYDDE